MGKELDKIGSMSIASSVLKPALCEPSVKPPHPLNKSRILNVIKVAARFELMFLLEGVKA